MERCRTSLANAFVLTSFAICCLSGCAGALVTPYYLLYGNPTPAESDALDKKKVVVVCRSAPQLSYSAKLACTELQERIGQSLKANGKKIDVVPSEKVEQYVDLHGDIDPIEVGRSVSAERVLVVDVEAFNIVEGQVYRGTSSVQLTVYDVADGGIVFEKIPNEFVFPPNVPVPLSEMREPQFRRMFVLDLARNLAQIFHSYEREKNFASDATVFK